MLHRALAAVAAGLLAAAGCVAPARALDLGMPSQGVLDGTIASSAMMVYWPQVTGVGAAGRPYVQRLVIDGIVVITGGTAASDPTPASGGGAAVVIEPFSTTANRVGVSLGAAVQRGMLTPDLAGVRGPAITASSVIDLTLRLGTLSPSFTWAWMNGNFISYTTTGLGTADAAVEVVFNPVVTPWINWASHGAAGNGCTQYPPANCNIAQADGEYSGASLVLSFEPGLNSDMTGGLFATTGAIIGYATAAPGASPSISIALSSAHTTSTGAPQLGSLQAFIPAATLLSLYTIAPSDAVAATFAVSRVGDPGSMSTPVFTPQGSAGVLMSVAGISFSAPKVQMRSKIVTFVPQASSTGGFVTVTGTLPQQTAKNCMGACLVWLRPITGSRAAMKSGAVVAQAAVVQDAFSVRVAKAKLGASYAASVYRWTGGNHYNLLTSGTGMVR